MPKEILSVDNITKVYRYKGKPDKHALKGVSFKIYEGEIFALLGVNGAGKTTLSSIISSIHPPTTGDIKWKGESIYDDLYSYRKQVGLCPQKSNLDKRLSLRENLYYAGLAFGMGKEESKHRLNHLIELFEMEEMADLSVHMLSGGYRQRFSIARTLMHQPKLILLDEPTVGLDPHIREELWNVVKKLKQEKVSILLTTHYLEEVERIADRVCIIDGGTNKLKIESPKRLKEQFEKSSLEDLLISLVKEEKRRNLKEGEHDA